MLVLAGAIYKRSIYDPINEALKEPISRRLNEAMHQQWGGLILITNHHNLAATPIKNYKKKYIYTQNVKAGPRGEDSSSPTRGKEQRYRTRDSKKRSVLRTCLLGLFWFLRKRSLARL